MTEDTHGDLAGKLLIATPLLLDPNFYRTVVYLHEHSADGAMGLVLNRLTPARLDDHLPQWAEAVSAPPAVFFGGPVSNEVAVGLAHRPEVPPDDWEPDSLGIGLVDLSLSPGTFGKLGASRVYSGYSGWTGGQLEAELTTGSWIVAVARMEDVFTPAPEDLWRTVLRRQKGSAGLYASFPDDPRAN